MKFNKHITSSSFSFNAFILNTNYKFLNKPQLKEKMQTIKLTKGQYKRLMKRVTLQKASATLNDYIKAIRIQISSSNESKHHHGGKNKSIRQRLNSSAELCEKCLSLYPSSKHGWNFVGQVYDHLEDQIEETQIEGVSLARTSLSCFEKHVQLGGQHPNAYFQIAQNFCLEFVESTLEKSRGSSKRRRDMALECFENYRLALLYKNEHFEEAHGSLVRDVSGTRSIVVFLHSLFFVVFFLNPPSSSFILTCSHIHVSFLFPLSLFLSILWSQRMLRLSDWHLECDGTPLLGAEDEESFRVHDCETAESVENIVDLLIFYQKKNFDAGLPTVEFMSRGTKTVDEVKKMRYWCDKFEKEPAGSIEDLLLSKGTYTISMLSLLFDCLGMAENFISESEIKTKVRCSGCDVRSFSCYFFFVHYLLSPIHTSD